MIEPFRRLSRFPLILLIVIAPTQIPVAVPAQIPVMAPARIAATARTLWTGPAGMPVYAAPSLHAATLTVLPDNQPVRVLAVDGTWGRTLLWNALPGWVRLDGLAPQPFVQPAVRHVPPPAPPLAGAHSPMPLHASFRVWEATFLRARPAFASEHLALLRPGARGILDAWCTDQYGSVWYHTVRAGVAGWVYGDAVTFVASPPASELALLAPLRGKGMWFTYALLRTSPAWAIVAAARAAGLSHLYVEVGRSNLGFYGTAGLAALLPAAHRAGIRVVAWVYPFLNDVPADVAMSVAAARFVAPSGDRPDGLLADVEENMAEPAVRAYGQILRATLGSGMLMAIATYPPQAPAGTTYPFATAALSWNVIVPMDYWHLHRRAYSAAEAYRYVQDSVQLIRARTNAAEPVEVLGQMFDAFESGVNSPNGAEIAACARAARDAGASGVGYFEWNHATPEEWGALAAIPPGFAAPSSAARALPGSGHVASAAQPRYRKAAS